MNRNLFVNVAFAVLFVTVVVLIVRTSSEKKNTERLAADITQMKDSIEILHRVVDSIEYPKAFSYISSVPLTHHFSCSLPNTVQSRIAH